MIDVGPVRIASTLSASPDYVAGWATSAGWLLVSASCGLGQLGDEQGGVDGTEPRGQVVTGTRAVAPHLVIAAVLPERHGVVPLGDIDQPWSVLGRHGVQGRVDQAEG